MVTARVANAGWKSITKVSGKDLLTSYGTIPIAECKKSAEDYL